MTTGVQQCTNPAAHRPHFLRVPLLSPNLVSCPGLDPEPLAPEQDRPEGQDFDWTPETLHIGDLAAVIVRLHTSESPAYRNAMVLWETLTGMDEPASLTYAYSIATVMPPVLAAPIPF